MGAAIPCNTGPTALSAVQPDHCLSWIPGYVVLFKEAGLSLIHISDDLISDEILLSDDDELVLSSEDESSSGLTEDNVAEEVLGMDDMADVDEEDDAIAVSYTHLDVYKRQT